jgi:prepilin-type N-terminal cleavage/methylation domain-containing protein
MRLPASRRSGLSLMEVLVSLAIFLMALTALTYLVNLSSNLAGEGQHRARCAQIARSKMNELIAGSIPLQGQPDASVDDEPDYRWSADVSAGATNGLYNVTVTVTFRPDDPYPVKVSYSRLIFDPQYAGSTQDVPAAPDGSAADDSSSGSSGSSGSGSSGSGSSGSGSSSAPTLSMGTAAKGATTGSAAKSASTGTGAKSSGTTSSAKGK